VDFTQRHSAEWLAHFAVRHPDVRPLAAGVEGAVYALGDGTVAKVWGRRTRPEPLLWQAFYADLAAAGLSFATPVILDVEEVRGVAVTVERELPGTQLREHGPIVDVLRELATVPATDAMRRLPVLDESRPFRGDDDFPAALTALLGRRPLGVLPTRVPDFDRRYEAVVAGLAALDRRPDTVLHGDLVGENVLVDASGRPSAVLDFGFLSGAGDPRFDAGVTAGIMDMYGPDAVATTERLTERIAAGLSYDPDVLRLYRAAYGIATATAFGSDSTDGHFAWCVRQVSAVR
jgi:Phosphotransferase enzyme family